MLSSPAARRDPFTTEPRSVQNSLMPSFSSRVKMESITEFYRVPDLIHTIVWTSFSVLPFTYTSPIFLFCLEHTRQVYTLETWCSVSLYLKCPPHKQYWLFGSYQMSHFYYFLTHTQKCCSLLPWYALFSLLCFLFLHSIIWCSIYLLVDGLLPLY